MIFVHNRDRRVYDVHNSALRWSVHREGERVREQKKEDRIASEAEQLLDSKLNDVPEMPQFYFSCFSSSMAEVPKYMRASTPSAAMLRHNDGKERALVKAPTLIA